MIRLSSFLLLLSTTATNIHPSFVSAASSASAEYTNHHQAAANDIPLTDHEAAAAKEEGTCNSTASDSSSSDTCASSSSATSAEEGEKKEETKPNEESSSSSSSTSSSTTKNQKYYGTTSSNITNCLITEQNPNRPTYDANTFVQLRNIYRKIQRQYPYAMTRIQEEEGFVDSAGIVIPFEVKTIPGTEYRGVFTTIDLPRGAKVWSPLYLGEFGTEQAWLAFLYAILEEYGSGDYDLGKHLACDALQWSYVMGTRRKGFDAVIDLDEGSFVNHGWTHKGEANIADGYLVRQVMEEEEDDEEEGDEEDEEDDQFCDSCMHATRDIQAGEQIMTDYTIFYVFGELEWYEASVAQAWDVDRSGTDPDGSRMQDGQPQWHYR